MAGPNVFSIEAWFKTSSTTGGKIAGLGNARSGLSTSFDRQIYMDNTGHVIFGVYNGARHTVTSPGRYNNNAWHHVVATLSGGGMALYLDGKKIGVNQGTTIGATYSGFWRVGGDNLGGWPGTHTSNYFRGVIDEVADLSDRADAAAGAVALHQQRARIDQSRGAGRRLRQDDLRRFA